MKYTLISSRTGRGDWEHVEMGEWKYIWALHQNLRTLNPDITYYIS